MIDKVDKVIISIYIIYKYQFAGHISGFNGGYQTLENVA